MRQWMRPAARKLQKLRKLAEQTPPSRQRLLDLLRALAITAVILGHWLVIVVDRSGGELTVRSALPELRWAHPVTWLVQVMPLFFLVGGYANAASLASARRRGGNAADWLVRRGARLVKPTSALVAACVIGALLARGLGADPVRVRSAVWLAAIPLWFLSVYVLVVAGTPVMFRLHRRYGVAVPLVLAALVAAGDLFRLFGDPIWGGGSFLFGWLLIHQAGFFWYDNRLTRRSALLLLTGGVGALLLLTGVGPYPVSMINVPGERLHNMSPPSLALLALAAAQLGTALLVRDRAERWLRRERPWLVVVGVNTVVLTLFNWHITAAVLLLGALHAVDLLPTPAAGSLAWFGWRVPWLIMLCVVLAVLVAIFAPIETRTARAATGRPRWLAGRPAIRLTLALIGFGAVAYGLFDNSLFPRNRPALSGFPAEALTAYLAGSVLLRLLRAPARRPGPEATPPPGSPPPAAGRGGLT